MSTKPKTTFAGKNPFRGPAAVSKWWGSAHEALEQWRQAVQHHCRPA